MTQEVEPFVLIRARAVGVLTVHHARLVRMEFQTDLRHRLGDGRQHLPCLGFTFAVSCIIRVTLERDRGIVFGSHESNA